jgi:hypothetical protein
MIGLPPLQLSQSVTAAVLTYPRSTTRQQYDKQTGAGQQQSTGVRLLECRFKRQWWCPANMRHDALATNTKEGIGQRMWSDNWACSNGQAALLLGFNCWHLGEVQWWGLCHLPGGILAAAAACLTFLHCVIFAGWCCEAQSMPTSFVTSKQPTNAPFSVLTGAPRTSLKFVGSRGIVFVPIFALGATAGAFACCKLRFWPAAVAKHSSKRQTATLGDCPPSLMKAEHAKRRNRS